MCGDEAYSFSGQKHAAWQKKKKSGRYIEEIIEDHSNVIDLDVRNISTVYYKK